jgi:16S rRNA U1498 N3-methylase RsmE
LVLWINSTERMDTIRRKLWSMGASNLASSRTIRCQRKLYVKTKVTHTERERVITMHIIIVKTPSEN